MNRGSDRVPEESGRSAPRFNEAPIHESGKSHFRKERPYGLSASMRPRFMNRGSENAVCQDANDDTRFNEAPIHESGKY